MLIPDTDPLAAPADLQQSAAEVTTSVRQSRFIVVACNTNSQLLHILTLLQQSSPHTERTVIATTPVHSLNASQQIMAQGVLSISQGVPMCASACMDLLSSAGNCYSFCSCMVSLFTHDDQHSPFSIRYQPRCRFLQLQLSMANTGLTPDLCI